jgi:CheY-like chemotaxis protein
MADVLVVDDDADSCRALVRLFEKAGHEAVCVFGGGEALALLQALRFHLVLLDLRMPVVGGMEVLKAIRSDPDVTNTAVVIFSAEGNPSVQEQALAEGANGYVHKPVRWGELYASVKPYLGNGATQ